MSLVAYASSSDQDSDCSEEEAPATREKVNVAAVLDIEISNGTISDGEEDYAPTEFAAVPNLIQKSGIHKLSSHSLSLPKPINVKNSRTSDDEQDEVAPKFSKLPLPRHKVENNVIIEEDDEFLHKKATLPVEEVKPKPVLVAGNKGPVKITIPSLKEFSDVDKDIADKAKNKPLPEGQKKTGLLSMLPQAKSEQIFSKATAASISNNVTTDVSKPLSVNPFIPDTVKNRRPAHNTEGVDGINKLAKKTSKTTNKPKLSLVNFSDSDGTDDEAGDFFSLNSEDKLPEVSMNEINALVAQRAARMANATTQFLIKAAENKHTHGENMEIESVQFLAGDHQQPAELNQSAMQALVGRNKKRRRKEENIQFFDISSAEVLPSREEWMRTALASSTAFQPTGVLVDEEPVAGTRRKHQITYLAHKAKANEAELQAMWSANRQNRRATQSKYGF